MPEQWKADVRPEPIVVTGTTARALVEDRQARGELMTWFESDRGRLLAFGSNGVRVMLMLLNSPEDAGEHATSPHEQGESTGYVLDNGQVDTYDNANTVPLQEALDNLTSIVESGSGLHDTASFSNR